MSQSALSVFKEVEIKLGGKPLLMPELSAEVVPNPEPDVERTLRQEPGAETESPPPKQADEDEEKVTLGASIKFVMAGDVSFDVGKAYISALSESSLGAIAEVILQHKDAVVLINGYIPFALKNTHL